MHAENLPGFFSVSGGTTREHSSTACGQRVRNTQPLGSFMGLGMSPFRIIRFDFAPGFGDGDADNNALL